MQALLDVILPVFLVIGVGYATVWKGYFSDEVIDGVMRYTQQIAFPFLLFRAIANLDLSANFDGALIFTYYTGAITCFALGFAGARFIFNRPLADCTAIGFCCLFSNSLLLGVPITERAYGPEALSANFVIVSLHTPICYGLGLTIMEIIRAHGKGFRGTAISILKAVFQNALILGIFLGALANLSGLTIPKVADDAIDLIARSALPAALFSLGGVLYRYRPEGDMATIGMVCGISLIVQPALTFGPGMLTGLTTGQLRSAVITAAMAPGVNTYIFANMYGVARRVAASSLLACTALAVLTTWVWLSLLP